MRRNSTAFLSRDEVSGHELVYGEFPSPVVRVGRAFEATDDRSRHADLVVLSADVFDEKAVPDDEIRRVRSLLTIVGGRVVYGDSKALR